MIINWKDNFFVFAQQFLSNKKLILFTYYFLSYSWFINQKQKINLIKLINIL